MTPASEEFAEIARRLAEIKAERTRTIAGEPPVEQIDLSAATSTANPSWDAYTGTGTDCLNTANPIDGPYC